MRQGCELGKAWLDEEGLEDLPGEHEDEERQERSVPGPWHPAEQVVPAFAATTGESQGGAEQHELEEQARDLGREFRHGIVASGRQMSENLVSIADPEP